MLDRDYFLSANTRIIYPDFLFPSALSIYPKDYLYELYWIPKYSWQCVCLSVLKNKQPHTTRFVHFLREYTRPHLNLFSRRVFFVFSSYILYKAVSQDSFLNKRNTPLCVMFNSNFFFFSFALVFLNAYETMTEIDLVDFPASRNLTRKYLYRQFLLDGFCPHIFWGFVSQTNVYWTIK